MGVAGVGRMTAIAACLLSVAMGGAWAQPVAPQPEVNGAAVEGIQPLGGQPQVKDDLFAGTEKFANGASDVTDVNLDRNMLGAVRGHGKDAGLANRLNFIVVHSYTYDKPGMYRMEDVEAYQKKLAGSNWNCFIHTRERKSGEATDICRRNGEGDEHELVIITAEPKELTFVHLSGKMPFNDMNSLGQLGSLGMLMAIPPVPPVPPVPPAPGVPAAPPAPPAPKLQKQGEPVSDVQRQWMEFERVAARVAPRLQRQVQRAEMRVLRAQMREVVAMRMEGCPEMRGQIWADTAELRWLSLPLAMQVEGLARSEALQQLERHPPQIDEKELEQRMQQFQQQIKEWESHRPQLDEQRLQEQMKQFGAQMKEWQMHRPEMEQRTQEQMQQFREQMKEWQSHMPQIDRQQMEEQMRQFGEQMKQWQSQRPEWNKELQEQMQRLQKEHQQERTRNAGEQHAV